MSWKDIFKKDKVDTPASRAEVKKAETDKPVKPDQVKSSPADISDTEVAVSTTAPVKKKLTPSVAKPGQLSARALLKPLNTEKGAKIAAAGKYIFMVNPQVNKIMIKQAVEATYGVKVAKVNVLNQGGKNVRFGRTSGRRKHWKKAIVTLAKGETIEVYKGV